MGICEKRLKIYKSWKKLSISETSDIILVENQYKTLLES